MMNFLRSLPVNYNAPPVGSWFGRDMFLQDSLSANQPTTFFHPQRNNRGMFDSSWSRQQTSKNTRPKEELFIDPEDYYDPVFGENKFKKRKSPKKCNCRNCSSTSSPENYKQLFEDEARKKTRRKKKQFNADPSTSDDDETNTVKPLPENVNNEKISEENTEHEDSDSSNMEKVERIEEMPHNAPDTSTITIQNEDTRDTGKEDVQEPLSAEETCQKEDHVVLKKIESIGKIKEEIRLLKEKVENLCAESKQYDFLYCEEMLTKCLLKLDDILAEGVETVRNARKQLVLEINEALSNLERRRTRKDIVVNEGSHIELVKVE